MDNEDNIAAALMAGFTSAQLKDIDKKTVEFKGIPANQLNPMSFLNGKQDQINNERQKIQDQINKEALERFPMPPPIDPVAISANVPITNSQIPVISKIDTESLKKISEASLIFAKAFDRISISLSKWLEKKVDRSIL